MEIIDSSILENGYSVYKTETGRYFAMHSDEVRRIHLESEGKPNYELADSLTASVIELVILPDKKIVQLNDIIVTMPANELTPVPIKIF